MQRRGATSARGTAGRQDADGTTLDLSYGGNSRRQTSGRRNGHALDRPNGMEACCSSATNAREWTSHQSTSCGSDTYGRNHARPPMQTTRILLAVLAVTASRPSCARPATTRPRRATAHGALRRRRFGERRHRVAGIVHYRVRRPSGPFDIQIVTVPGRVAVRAHRGPCPRFAAGRERVTDMVRRRQERGDRIPVALNADFFDLRTGANENNQVIDGLVWKANPVTDSPFDTFRNSHIQFAVGANGRPYLDRFSYAGASTGRAGGLCSTASTHCRACLTHSILFSRGVRRRAAPGLRARAARARDARAPTTGPGMGALELSLSGAAPRGARPAPSSARPRRARRVRRGGRATRLDCPVHGAAPRVARLPPGPWQPNDDRRRVAARGPGWRKHRGSRGFPRRHLPTLLRAAPPALGHRHLARQRGGVPRGGGRASGDERRHVARGARRISRLDRRVPGA